MSKSYNSKNQSTITCGVNRAMVHMEQLNKYCEIERIILSVMLEAVQPEKDFYSESRVDIKRKGENIYVQPEKKKKSGT